MHPLTTFYINLKKCKYFRFKIIKKPIISWVPGHSLDPAASRCPYQELLFTECKHYIAREQICSHNDIFEL